MLKLSSLQPENALGTGLASAIKRSSAEGKKQKTRPWQKKNGITTWRALRRW
jgi:hypothetical protein